jgi:riboflavin kinase/FMN adenylyltransferase
MNVGADFGPIDAQARGCVVSIGVFDGVHRGHRRVLEILRETATRRALPTVALTFDPHPRLVLQPHKALPMLVSLRRRQSLLLATGYVDRCVVLPFDQRQREQSADDFVRETLVGTLGMRALVVGENFVCGRGRVGTIDYLRKLGLRFGFTVHAVEMDMPHGTTSSVPSSSTEARRLIQAGEVARAASLLGRPHELECVVGGSLSQTRGYELMLPAGMCVPAAGTYTALLSVSHERLVRASVQLIRKEDAGGVRCLLQPAGDQSGPTPRPGMPVTLRFLDALHSGITRDIEAVMAA